MPSPSVVIVSPALAAANNGNWQTARRWATHLRSRHVVRITDRWPDVDARRDDVLLALHARRSAAAVQAWAGTHGRRGLGLALTGTDLYQDLAQDPSARRSVDLAAAVVVLQDQAAQALPEPVRSKVRLIYQSTTQRQPVSKGTRELRVVVVGHLREVKRPDTVFGAARLLETKDGIRIDHYGAADDGWAGLARAAEAACPYYRWHGSVSHAQARLAIQRAHVLVHPSRLEGGAHVVMEAVCSGTPVLASRVPGNLGMLGPDYEGYFELGDVAGLARRLRQMRSEQLAAVQVPAGALLERLRAQCGRRAPLFSPEAERAALLQLVQDLQEAR
ncbi:MAG TPA: selenoneine biosynthesis selenosugar synthase SenB [Ramlibacter sp.]|nr:selenoneine biosynthesis selenosugar synthase SenB [Ramlibacter sp.]